MEAMRSRGSGKCGERRVCDAGMYSRRPVEEKKRTWRMLQNPDDISFWHILPIYLKNGDMKGGSYLPSSMSYTNHGYRDRAIYVIIIPTKNR